MFEQNLLEGERILHAVERVQQSCARFVCRLPGSIQLDNSVPLRPRPAASAFLTHQKCEFASARLFRDVQIIHAESLRGSAVAVAAGGSERSPVSKLCRGALRQRGHQGCSHPNTKQDTRHQRILPSRKTVRPNRTGLQTAIFPDAMDRDKSRRSKPVAWRRLADCRIRNQFRQHPREFSVTMDEWDCRSSGTLTAAGRRPQRSGTDIHRRGSNRV